MSDPVDNHNVSPSNADNSISSNLPPPPPSNATVNQLSGMSVQIFQIPLTQIGSRWIQIQQVFNGDEMSNSFRNS